jgi:high mobility group protein B2
MAAYIPPADKAADQPSTSTAALKPTKKEKKVFRDPEAPKRALSSFMLWCQDVREAVREELQKNGSQGSVAEVGKELGLRWSCVTADTKKKYEDLAAVAKEEYRSNMAEYTPSKEFILKRQQQEEKLSKKEQKKKLAAKKDPAAPKRPQSAYLLWVSDHREEVKAEMSGSPSGPELLKELAKRWQHLDEKSKAVYEARGLAEKDKYAEAMAAYKLGAVEKAAAAQEAVDLPEIVKKKAVAGEEVADPPGIAKKKATPSTPSAFLTWAREHKAAVKEELGGNVTSQLLSKELARRWKGLDKAKKASYKVGLSVFDTYED